MRLENRAEAVGAHGVLMGMAGKPFPLAEGLPPRLDLFVRHRRELIRQESVSDAAGAIALNLPDDLRLQILG